MTSDEEPLALLAATDGRAICRGVPVKAETDTATMARTRKAIDLIILFLCDALETIP